MKRATAYPWHGPLAKVLRIKASSAPWRSAFGGFGRHLSGCPITKIFWVTTPWTECCRGKVCCPELLVLSRPNFRWRPGGAALMAQPSIAWAHPRRCRRERYRPGATGGEERFPATV